MKKLKLSIVAMVLIAIGFSASAQEKFRHQAMFVYNFTRMTAWPQEYQSGDFVIGILGNSPILQELETLAGTRQVGSQKIVIKQFASVDAVEKCHMIYVASNQTRNIADLSNKLRSEKIAALLITENRNALTDGASVNFIIENDRQRYELSESNARALGLSLGSEMTRLASSVK